MKSELSRLENWNKLLASEVINYWLNESRSELPNHYLSDKELKAFYLGLETGEFLL